LVVDVAGNGLQRLRHAREIEYDAVVLDVALPEMNGIEVCRRLGAQR
jgi:DNA-binding response OmpR family regulator